jgi:hypothetical protein
MRTRRYWLERTLIATHSRACARKLEQYVYGTTLKSHYNPKSNTRRRDEQRLRSGWNGGRRGRVETFSIFHPVDNQLQLTTRGRLLDSHLQIPIEASIRLKLRIVLAFQSA